LTDQNFLRFVMQERPASMFQFSKLLSIKVVIFSLPFTSNYKLRTVFVTGFPLCVEVMSLTPCCLNVLLTFKGGYKKLLFEDRCALVLFT
jgi:hypothetical protein